MPTFQVGASSDDCSKYWTGSAWSFLLTYTTQRVGYLSASYYKWGGGMRLQNVTIPQGATIITAYLTFRAAVTLSGTAVNSYIKGEASDNAAAFSNQTDFDSRSRTSAQINWDNIPAWTAGNDYQSPEIKTIIQEIVNRPSWSNGNALVIFWDDFDDRSSHAASCYRSAHSWDGSSTYAPKLYIEYATVTEKTSSDTGSGADAKVTGNPLATLVKAETGAGLDVVAQARAILAGAEVGSGADAYVSLLIFEARFSSDVGLGVEGALMPTAILAGSEIGSGIDAIIARLLAAVDTGTGTEVSSLFQDLSKELFATELGQGIDALVVKREIFAGGEGTKFFGGGHEPPHRAS